MELMPVKAPMSQSLTILVNGSGCEATVSSTTITE